MKFTTRAIAGGTTGSVIGLPTMALSVPEMVPISLPRGMHAAWAEVRGYRYPGMLYYGPDSFLPQEQSFEFLPFDTVSFSFNEGDAVGIQVVKMIREPRTFDVPEQLFIQLNSDAEHARSLLHI